MLYNFFLELCNSLTLLSIFLVIIIVLFPSLHFFMCSCICNVYKTWLKFCSWVSRIVGLCANLASLYFIVNYLINFKHSAFNISNLLSAFSNEFYYWFSLLCQLFSYDLVPFFPYMLIRLTKMTIWCTWAVEFYFPPL